MVWKILLRGPEATPYSGGTECLDGIYVLLLSNSWNHSLKPRPPFNQSQNLDPTSFFERRSGVENETTLQDAPMTSQYSAIVYLKTKILEWKLNMNKWLKYDSNTFLLVLYTTIISSRLQCIAPVQNTLWCWHKPPFFCLEHGTN